MLPYLFLLIAVAFRSNLIAHPFAFTPTAAALLFFGARASRRQWWIPVVLLAATDVFLTKVVYAYPLTADHIVTFAWYGAMVLLGSQLAGAIRPVRIAGAAVASSASFFLISNFMVWLVWNMYPKTLSGLMMSYSAGVPFFRQLGADVVFTAAFFGIAALVEARQTAANKIAA